MHNCDEVAIPPASNLEQSHWLGVIAWPEGASLPSVANVVDGFDGSSNAVQVAGADEEGQVGPSGLLADEVAPGRDRPWLAVEEWLGPMLDAQEDELSESAVLLAVGERHRSTAVDYAGRAHVVDDGFAYAWPINVRELEQP